VQSAVVFQSFGIACRAIDAKQEVLPYVQVCMAGAQYFLAVNQTMCFSLLSASTDYSHMHIGSQVCLKLSNLATTDAIICSLLVCQESIL